MLVIQIARNVWGEINQLPLLVRIGLALMPLAFVGDIFVQMAPAAHHHHSGFVPHEHIAHLAGILAMVLVLAGVVIDAARRHRSRRRSSHANR
ncbi:MAG TPA: hypothetical protein VJ975_01130 [Candidatus Limnocylindria bacterium]|nr:hypothetical protein [Candidatus Limnocylindria bacterium]